MSCSLFFSSLAGEFSSPSLVLHHSLICRVSKKFSLDIFYLMWISRHLVVSSSCLLNIFWNGTEDSISSSSSSTKHVRTCCCHVIWANSTNPPRIMLLLSLFLSLRLHLHHLYPYAAAWQTFVEHFPLWFSCFFRSLSLWILTVCLQYGKCFMFYDSKTGVLEKAGEWKWERQIVCAIAGKKLAN